MPAVLPSFADEIFHLGPFGAGQVGKMVNNLILWACISADNEGLGWRRSSASSSARCVRRWWPRRAGNWALANEIWKYPMPWAEKDMGIVLKEADEARLSFLPLCGVVKEVVKGLKIARGEGMPEAGG